MRTNQNFNETCTPTKSFNFNPSSKLSLSQTKQNNTFTSTSIKDFLPLIMQNNIFNSISQPSFTPLKKQPQQLLSPSPIKKDLFSQLLGSQRKPNSPGFGNLLNNNAYSYSSIMQEQDYAEQYQDTSNQNKQQNQNQDNQNNDQDHQDSQMCSEDSQNCYSADQNGIKKRKRKSTAQIKILKQQLDGQMNWTKQKIVKMAEITGLSQSQVYKWCWDQKKKNVKHHHNKQNKENLFNKKKIIKKDYLSKYNLPQNHQLFDKFQENNINYVNQFNGCIQQLNENSKKNQFQRQTKTKLKPLTLLMIQENQMNATQKKVNKKLIFN